MIVAIISKVYQVDNKIFKEIIQESYSYSECLRKLGLKTSGGSSTDILKRRIKELDYSIEHFCSIASGVHAKYTLNEILIENSTYTNIASLKRRILNKNLLIYECEVCGISEWNNKFLSLHLDHKNGINNDHRLKNLRFICPNCHSQTETYAGKNKGIR